LQSCADRYWTEIRLRHERGSSEYQKANKKTGGASSSNEREFIADRSNKHESSFL